MKSRAAILLLVALAVATPAAAEPVDVVALNEALRSLTGQVLQHKPDWSKSTDGRARWIELDRAINRAKIASAQLEEVAPAVASAERDVDACRISLVSTLAELDRLERLVGRMETKFDLRAAALNREIDAHNARRSSALEGTEAEADFNQEAEFLDQRWALFEADHDRTFQDIAAMGETALAAWNDAKREHANATIKHAMLLELQNEALADFHAAQQSASATLKASASGPSSEYSSGDRSQRSPVTASVHDRTGGSAME